MHYILDDQTAGINFCNYFSYLRSIEARLPKHIFEFASNPQHYDLTSHSSLHDAWLEGLTINEEPRNKIGQLGLEVHLVLLGPFHDRKIHLKYSQVKAVQFHWPSSSIGPEKEPVHRDVITHEIRLDSDGLLTHELLFDQKRTLSISFRDFAHQEELISL